MARRSILPTLVIGVVGLMLVSGLVLAVVLAVRAGGALPGSGRVAVLPVEGVIGDDQEYLDQLRDFREDHTVKALVVAINSPGGSVGPSQSLYRELKRMREEEDIPVIASIGGVGASGGYYVALAADSIFVLPGSLTGSIGVIMEFPEVSGLMDKIGVGMQVVKSAEHKDIGSPFRPMTPEDKAILDAMVGDVYGQFFNAVLVARKMNADSLRRIADGRVVSGNQALRAGLVDREGNLRDAIRAAGRMAGLGRDPDVVYPHGDRPTLMDLVLGRESSEAATALTRNLRNATSPQLKYMIPF